MRHKNMDRDVLIVVLLGVLLLVSAVQTYELVSLKGKIASAQAGVGTATVSTAPAASSPQASGGAPSTVVVPKSLQNLPSQVGGC